MVARNFPTQDIPYSQLLQIPDDDSIIHYEELKPQGVGQHNVSCERNNVYEKSNTLE